MTPVCSFLVKSFFGNSFGTQCGQATSAKREACRKPGPKDTSRGQSEKKPQHRPPGKASRAAGKLRPHAQECTGCSDQQTEENEPAMLRENERPELPGTESDCF